MPSGRLEDEDHAASGMIARALRRLVLLRRGEGKALFWSATYFFFLLCGYYMLRPVRETMGVQRSMNDLAWLFTGTMVAMLFANPLFSWLVSRTTRRRFIPITYHFFSLNLLMFYAVRQFVSDEQAVYVGYAFYIWLSVFNLFAVSVFWAFMADVFTSEQGKRLFACIGVGGTLGAMVGAALTTGLAREIGVINLLLVSILFLQCAVFAMGRVARLASGVRNRTPGGSDLGEDGVHFHTAEPSRDWLAGLKLLLRSPYLLGIALYISLMTILATLVYFEQAKWVSSIFETDESRTAAFAMIDLCTNILTLALQLFLTSRLLRAIGVGPMLAILPLLTVIGFVALTVAPLFATFAIFQVSRRATQYAIARPTREVLFTIVSPDEKYKSKAFIDTFVYRGGDLLGAWTHRAIAWAMIMVAPVAAAVGVGWCLVGLYLGMKHRAMAASHRKDVASDGA